jgi:hypothetical protein
MAAEEESCGMWMGPSPIKEHEQHGFGLGVFTGKYIKAGQTVDMGLMVPVYDWDGDDHHPPLREYMWNGDNIPRLSLSSVTGVFYFTPGIGSIVPCTSKNANLRHSHEYITLSEAHNDATAGSYSSYQSTFFQAARDISPGEEFVVECDDDNFDGGTYSLTKYHLSNPKEEIICLDDTIEVKTSQATPSNGGNGVFAKRRIQIGDVVVSSPVVPLSRKDAGMNEDIVKEFNVPKEQLLLNYCFGDPNSDLLLLPYGPTVGYINHHSQKPNVKIQWHTSKNPQKLTRRQEHHHPELLELPASVVSEIHGKGLMLDYIALRDLEPGEEIFIDYGESWTRSWLRHSAQWQSIGARDYHYETAEEYTNKHDTEVLKTPKEQYQHPYPSNIMFACLHSNKWNDPEPGVDYIEHDYFGEDADDSCLAPCTIEDRYVKNFDDGINEIGEKTVYRVKLIEVSQHRDIEYDCLLVPDVEYELVNIPREAIHVLNRPYTTDTFQPKAFRHEIQVPDGLYPDLWMAKKVRRRQTITVENVGTDHDSFKRKVTREPPAQKQRS